MPLKTDSIDLWIFYCVTAGLLAILAYLLFIKYKAYREQRNIAAVTALLIQYFRKSGVEVSVGCVKLLGNKRVTALIESEPMKRFRLSHIIEMTLREHVYKTCGLELDKIYWRFPIKEANREAPAAGSTDGAAESGGENGDTKAPAETDEYINEGLVHHKHLPKFEVTETSWEQFEEASTKEPEKK